MFPSGNPTEAVERPNTFRLLLAYDGTDYFGWQVQPGRSTIQGTLAEAVRQITNENVLPQGSGRTDTGVHADGQVVSLALRANVPADRLLRALNRKLPPAIRILSARVVPTNFHARSGVLHKTYEYRIFQRRVPSTGEERVCMPAEARFVWDCRWPLQLEAMQHAAAHLVGTHDFTSFMATDPDRSQRQATGAGKDAVRTLYSSSWHQGPSTLVYRVTGSGFLHHMVRNIVGTCVLAGAGRLDPHSLPAILQARDRRSAGPTAPPKGLHLQCVVYQGDEVPPADAPVDIV